MSRPIISVEGLGKRYYLSHEKRHDTLRDTLTQGARGLWRRLTDPAGSGPGGEEFWALRDVSFEVAQGDVVGIIGRNGAGKSTLLKILSRITEPTTGRATIRGRVASLLEVGTGFHPELSGRDNIFLNGAILGMSRAEIARKFDEIVAFAEVERFLDTQVKHYSSGMYVRLAFSVAAHLEPEVLIVDEVLAVGDAAFQKKCLGKMREVTRSEGRTILFVSHNLGALQALCNQAIFLRQGRLVSQGGTAAQITLYNREQLQASAPDSFQARRITATLVLERFTLVPNPLHSGESLDLQLVFSSAQPVVLPEVCVVLQTVMGVRVAIIDLRRPGRDYRIEPGAPLVISGRVSHLNLVEGEYLAGLYLNLPEFRGDLPDLQTLTVLASAQPRQVVPYAAHDRGYVELNVSFPPA